MDVIIPSRDPDAPELPDLSQMFLGARISDELARVLDELFYDPTAQAARVVQITLRDEFGLEEIYAHL